MSAGEKRRFGTLAAQLWGDPRAPAVVLSHSILASCEMWRGQVDMLVRRRFFVVGLDTRGHGASSPTKAPYTMTLLVHDVLTVLDTLGIARAHFVGLSLGGMIGLGLGIEHGERIASLVVCDARADATGAFRAPWPERIKLAQERGCEELADSTLERWFGRAFLDANPEQTRWLRAMIARTSVAGFTGCAHALMALDYLRDVHRIQTPTTLIVGANDGALPEAMADLQRRIAGSVLEIIDRAGHLPNIERPQLFEAALTGHFDRVAPRA